MKALGVSVVQTLFQWLVWVLAAAAAFGVSRRESPTPTACQALPAAHRIVGVPLAEPRRDWCGPAALAAVLQYHGEETTAAEIAEAIYLPGYRGTLNLDLLLWARKRGYDVWEGEGSAEMMKQALARNRPVICMVRRRGPLADRNHFVVVRGYDDTRKAWFADGGAGKAETLSVPDFERDWRECGRWMLVVEGKADHRRSEGQNAVP